MANINSLMSSTSATSNLYGTRNVLSGLASGMDTESMIENSVSGYKTKITQLQQQQTKYEWKQDAYRGITDAMYDLTQKYTSYTSKTNLYSNSFFNGASVTNVSGVNKDNVSAVGKTNSDVQILSAQMATAARYSVSGSALSYGGAQNVGNAIRDFSAVGGKEVNVTFNGVTKAITVGANIANGNDLKTDLQNQINAQFGNGKVEVKFDNGALSFSTTESASTLKVAGKNADASSALGLGEDGLTNYLNTNKTIKSLLGANWVDNYADVKTSGEGLTQKLDSDGNDIAGLFTDSSGKYYKKLAEDNYVLSDSSGNVLHNLTINGTNIQVSENASLGTVMGAINSSDAGVSVSYSQLTNQFVFNAKETGAANGIQFGNGDGSDLSERLFGQINSTNYTKGTDATVIANVNGQNVALTRASNTFDVDGMSVTLKNSFGSSTKNTDGSINVDSADVSNAVSFSSKTDSDSIISTIKTFVDDYNSVLKQLHDAYATQPAEKSSSTHAKYDPLTEDDKADMSEKAVEKYEEKAKQGILFGDSDLRAAYDRLVSAITPGGADGATLRDIGINTTFSGGLTQISLNEEKLRTALDSNPDRVRDAFTKSKEGGASTDGLMTSIKNTMERYASTSIATPGVLVKKAGSTHSSTSLLSNDVQKQIDRVQEQIEKWQTKMSSKIDYYTRQFTALEKLMNTMNSQSSALAGLMGG